MGTETGIDFAGLESFTQGVRSQAGWLLTQCGIPTTTAMDGVKDAVHWSPDAVDDFAGTWDRHIALISQDIASLVAGLDAVVSAFAKLDSPSGQ